MDLIFLSPLLFLLGTATILWPKSLEMAAHYVGMMFAAAGSAVLLYKSGLYLLSAGMLESVNGWLVAGKWGSYSLNADLWSAPFLVITGLAGFIISLYGIDYAKGYRGNGLRALTGQWNLFLLSMVMVLLAGDAFTFILAWEVMALVSFLLVNHESSKKETVSAAYQYMIMTHLGTAAILVAFYILGSGVGSFSFAEFCTNQLPADVKHIVFCFAFAGFALKSGLMPLHVWLPNAHPAAPSHVSALMSGVMLKVAVYGFGRFVFQFIGIDTLWQGGLVMTVGLISAFLGVLYANMEKDMKRILAYSSVENMGIIFTGFGCGMILKHLGLEALSLVAFTAVLVHAFTHSLMKCLLFMSAGCVMHATGSKNIEIMGGLAKKMPWTAFFTLIGSMSLASLPFTGGLVGEWLTLQSLYTLAVNGGDEIRLLVVFGLILMGLTGALALGCFVRLFGVVFLGRCRSKTIDKAHEQPFFMVLALGIEAVLIIAVGIFPSPLVAAMEGIFTGGNAVVPMATDFALLWSGTGNFYNQLSAYCPIIFAVIGLALFGLCYLSIMGNTLVRSEVTWNCGTYPTARQQYSATGFSKPLRRAFDFILKPRREKVYLEKEHDYFGRIMRFNLFVPDRFTDRLYHPIEHFMVRISSTLLMIQQGSVRLYIAYTMIAMVAVLLWGVM